MDPEVAKMLEVITSDLARLGSVSSDLYDYVRKVCQNENGL
jgi:hypothetical protein